MFRRKNVAKGLAAGAMGGLVATIVMTQFQNAWQATSRSLKKKKEDAAPEVTGFSRQSEETWGRQTGTEGAPVSTAKVYSVRQTSAEKAAGDKEEQSGNNKEEGDNATTKVANAVAKASGKDLSPDQKKTGGTIVHYAFGTLMGAAYGVAMELGSRRIRKNPLLSGLGFGAALFAGADEVAVPALRLSQPPSEVPTAKHLYGFASHLVYGTTAAAVCKAARKALQ
jgi:hypothetical protein